jgi:phage terminase small subunit
MDTEDQTKPAEFDWDDAAKLLGATPRQVKFAQAKIRGANNTQAARAAGYGGDDDALRRNGYSAARSDKVKSLIKWAESEGAGLSDAEWTPGEGKRLLARIARGEDKQASIRAIEALNKIEAAEAERAREQRWGETPFDVCEHLSRGTGLFRELGPVLAVLVADLMDMKWRMTESQRRAAERTRYAYVLSALDQMGLGETRPDGTVYNSAGGLESVAPARADGNRRRARKANGSDASAAGGDGAPDAPETEGTAA